MAIGYVTLEEANEYIATRYTSTSPERQAWDALSDADKQVRLQTSADSIDSMPYPGRKASTTQVGAFPRCPYNTVPIQIKYAQIENAIGVVDEAEQSNAVMYQRMRTFGVSSYSIDDLSETLIQGSSSGEYIVHGITSMKAQTLLKPFLGGAYNIE